MFYILFYKYAYESVCVCACVRVDARIGMYAWAACEIG